MARPLGMLKDAGSAQKFFYALAHRLRCEEFPLRCLMTKPIESIMSHSRLYTNDPYRLPLVWSAVVESDGFSGEPFLLNHPMEILGSGDFNTEVQVIIGDSKNRVIESYHNLWPITNFLVFL